MLSIDAKPFEVWQTDFSEWVVAEVDRSGESDEIATVDSFADRDEAYEACDAWNAENAENYENYLLVMEQQRMTGERVIVWLEVEPGRSADDAAQEACYRTAQNDPTTFGFGEHVVECLGAVPVWRADALLGFDPEIDLIVKKDAMDTIRAYNQENP